MPPVFTFIDKLSSAFSNGSVYQKWQLFLKFWYFAITRKFFSRGVPMKFSLSFFGKTFVIFLETNTDIASLYEVFVLEEYAWEPIENPKVILDLGAHFGDTALYYSLKYPEARIYAVEPAPDTFERLCLNTQNINTITPIQVGVAKVDGFAQLHIALSSFGHSFNSRSDSRSTVSVPVCTLTSLMRLCKIERADIIKFDIEGSEEDLFVDVNPKDFAEAYIGEVHADLMSITPEVFLSTFTDFSIESESLTNVRRFILKAKINYEN